jgi:choline kinase
VRYLILAAGMGRRMANAHGRATPKCLLDIGGEPLIARLLRQIRSSDANADIHAVLGYRSETIAPLLDGCRIVVNPFFDITGINASLWFARGAFDAPITVIHGDVVLADDLVADLSADRAESLIAYDSRILDPKEINVAVADGRVVRFGVNWPGYSGAYAGLFRLSAEAAPLFAGILDRRVRRGFNEPRTYYFFVIREMIARGTAFAPFDFARHRWQEIDYPADLAAARERFGRGADER